jgi:hypothetical protein
MNMQQGEQNQQQIVKGQHRYEQAGQQYVATGPYQHRKYPKIKYHVRDGQANEVKNEVDEKMLGQDWQDQRPVVKDSAKSQDELRQENEELKKQLAAALGKAKS